MPDLEGSEGGAVYKTTIKSTTSKSSSSSSGQSMGSSGSGSSGGGGSAGPVSMAELAARYGFAKAFFGSDQELEKLIQDARRGNWSVEKFQARFMATNWYRKRSAAVRTWADLVSRDPTEARAKTDDRVAQFKDQLTQLGINVSAKELRSMATASLQYGWSSTQIRDVMAGMVTYVPGKMGGTPAALEMQVKQLADDYGVSASKGQLGSWIQGMLSERYTEDNIRDFLRDMAKSKYAGMAGQLDRGFTVRDVAGEYINSYARLLEVDAGAVSLNDKLIQKALQGAPMKPGDPPQMQSVYQFEQALRDDPRWLRTKNARNDMLNAGMGILRDWGFIGN